MRAIGASGSTARATHQVAARDEHPRRHVAERRRATVSRHGGTVDRELALGHPPDEGEDRLEHLRVEREQADREQQEQQHLGAELRRRRPG